MQFEFFSSFLVILFAVVKLNKALPTSEENCNTYYTCTSCLTTKTESQCNWCLDSHRCTQNTESCHNDVFIKTSDHDCPKINVPTEDSEILVPAGVSKAIKIKVHIPVEFIVQTRFVCQFNIEGKVISTNAQLLGDTLYCDAIEFKYTSESQMLKVPFAAIWGGSKPLDNPNNLHIVIYRCSTMANSCENCLKVAEKYNCGWCSTENICETQDFCNRYNGINNNWLNHMKTCPKI